MKNDNFYSYTLQSARIEHTPNFWSVGRTGIKDPSAVLTFPIDCNPWILEFGDYYLHHEITTTQGLTCKSSIEDGGIIYVVIAGGELGKTEKFTIKITTENGMIDKRSFNLYIRER